MSPESCSMRIRWTLDTGRFFAASTSKVSEEAIATSMLEHNAGETSKATAAASMDTLIMANYNNEYQKKLL